MGNIQVVLHIPETIFISYLGECAYKIRCFIADISQIYQGGSNNHEIIGIAK